MLHFRKAMAHWNGTAPKLVNFTTLSASTPNIFGGTERFTDSMGGQIYGAGNGSISNYKIDHKTGLGIYKISIYNTNGTQWAAWIDQYLGSDFGGVGTYKDSLGFTNWFAPNALQSKSIFHYVIGFNYSPFSNNSGDRMYWTSTTAPSSSRAYFLRGVWATNESNESKTAGWVNNFYQFRKHF